MHKHHVKLNQILESAVNDDLMRKNPCKKARVPKIDTPEASFLNAKEIARLRACVDAAEDEAYQRLHEKEERMAKLPKTAGRETVSGMNSISCLIAVRLGMATGARVGEVMGFEWQDVSSDYVKISVRRTIERNGAIKDKPKTKSGRRTISIDSKTADSLKRWRKQQHELLRSLGLDQNGRTPICCSNAATHFSNSNFERWWRIWRTEQGFPDLNFHKLRHTQATQLLGNNIPLTTVSARLGHKTPSITLNFYSHAIPEQDEEAAQLIGEILQGNPEPAHIIPMKTA